MQTSSTRQITRRQFLKTSAAAGLILGLAPHLPGCANDPWLYEDQGIKNPFNGFTIGDAYLINQDKLSHANTAFNIEDLAKLTYPMSKTQDVEIITTTNRASRTEDDFSFGVAATVKAKFLGGSGGVSNAYNRSNSKVNVENTLTWSSRDTRTGQVFSINWENYKYTDFYGCLSKKAQQRLADIFDFYDQTVQLIAAGKINTAEGQAVAKKYQEAVKNWYSSYGCGFVSGLWVGMLGKADLTITSKASNTTTRWSNSSSVSYAKPVAGGGLNVAVNNLSAEYGSQAKGSVVVAVMPADSPDMQKWKASWLEKFTGKLDSISDMVKIDPSPSAYTGTPVTPPELDLPTAKVDPKVSDKFKVTDLDSAKACAQVIDWEKNRNEGESFEDYLARKEQEKKGKVEKFDGKGKPGQFEQEVQEIIDDNALRLIGTDVSLAVEADPNPSTTPWADFMRQWTTLGVYITRWADVIPPLTMAADVSSTDADLTSGLVYLWALRYQTELIRFADYIDLCYSYAVYFAWKDQATNIVSFGNQLRNFAKSFDAAIKNQLDKATKDPTRTSKKVQEELLIVKNDQLAQMSMKKMYACWSQNYDFFKQADFGCGLAMMPGGYGTDAPQLFLAGPHEATCYEYDYAFEVNWLLKEFDSKNYVRQPELFANLPKLLPLISADGKIMFLMIGSNRNESWDAAGMLDASMMMRDSGHYDHGEAFAVGSLSIVENEPRVFLAKDVSQRVYDFFAWHYDKGSARYYGSRIYKDPGSSDALYLAGRSAVGRCGENSYLSNAFCGEKTIFYLVPLSGFAEGTKVRGVKISEELPDYVANPFNLYSSSTAEQMLEDTPSAVYESTLPTSTEDYIDNVLNKYRVWKGIVPAPE